MNAETITFFSGIALLAVFALVGWNLKRNHARDEHTDGKSPGNDAH
jgi:hypothetical protein